MSTFPIISVLMAVYNGERFLVEAVESILKQSFTQFEFIIVDDGSTDGTAEILRKFQSADSRIKLLHQENRGLPASLNRCFEVSRGEFIARMDADDISLPDRFEKQLNFLKAHPHIDICGGQLNFIDEDGEFLRLLKKPCSHEAVMRHSKYGTPITHATSIMRREVMEGVTGYREFIKNAEDYDFLLRVMEKHFVMANHPEVLYLYRHNNSGMTHSKKKLQCINARLIYKLHRQRVRGHEENATIIQKLSRSSVHGEDRFGKIFRKCVLAVVRYDSDSNVLTKLIRIIPVLLYALLDIELLYYMYKGMRIRQIGRSNKSSG